MTLASAIVLILAGSYAFASTPPGIVSTPSSPVSLVPLTPTVSQDGKAVQDTTGNSDEGAQEIADENVKIPAGAISEATAKQIALMANTGTTVTAVETESEGSSIVYTISLSNGSDVKVDVTKGSIVKTELKWSKENDGKDESVDNGKESAEDAQDLEREDDRADSEDTQSR